MARFADVLKAIPIRTYNEEAFLNNNTYTEVKDGNFFILYASWTTVFAIRLPIRGKNENVLRK